VRRRDWIIVLLLSAVALVFAWPDLRESNLGLVLSGRCDDRVRERFGGGRGGSGWRCVEAPERREGRPPDDR
jgi:hypothetical protein